MPKTSSRVVVPMGDRAPKDTGSSLNRLIDDVDRKVDLDPTGDLDTVAGGHIMNIGPFTRVNMNSGLSVYQLYLGEVAAIRQFRPMDRPGSIIGVSGWSQGFASGDAGDTYIRIYTNATTYRQFKSIRLEDATDSKPTYLKHEKDKYSFAAGESIGVVFDFNSGTVGGTEDVSVSLTVEM